MNPADDARALEALGAILSRPEFTRRPALSPWDVFWSGVWELIWDFLRWLFRPVGEAVEGRLGWVDLALLAIAAIAILGGIWFVARTVRGHMAGDGATAAREAVRRRERSDHLWAEAHALATQGRLAEAVRTLYLSALYALEERDVLAVQESLTNREHAERLARARPNAGGAFAEVVQRYDRLRYGGAIADASAFGELSDLVRRARALPAA